MKKWSVSSLLFVFNILHNHEVILNRLEEGPFFEVFDTFLPGFSVKCVAIGLIAHGCSDTDVIICVAT